MLALGAYALVALLLAAVGLYGLLSHMVGTRQREIGIRLALGAQIRSVRALVVREAALLAAAGVIVGLGFGLAATRALTTLLYGVSARDPVTFRSRVRGATRNCHDRNLGAARTATRIDPMHAMRGDP